MNIEIPIETESLLRSKAQAAGMDVSEYVVHLVNLDEPQVEYSDKELTALAFKGLASGLTPREHSDFKKMKDDLIRQHRDRQNGQ